jgi:iron complex transport system substrate-binding protein
MNLKKTALVLLAVILASSLLIAGCTNEEKVLEKEGEVLENKEKTPETITVTDQEGREVTVPKEINRIVALGGPALRDVAILGAADKLVGTDLQSTSGNYFCVQAYPQIMDLPIVGTFNEPNIEAILELQPDLVLVSAAYTNADDVQGPTGIPTVALMGPQCDIRRYDDTYESLRIAGKLLGLEDRAEWLITYAEDKLNPIREITSKIPEEEKPKVYALVVHGINGTLAYAPLEWAGGYNVAKDFVISQDLWSARDIDPEKVLEWAPDVIIFGGSGGSTFADVLKAHPGLEATKAAKEGRIYQIFGPNFYHDLIQLVTETEYLAKLLHPDKFQDLDVEKEGNKMFKEVYGVDDLYNKVEEVRGLELYHWD